MSTLTVYPDADPESSSVDGAAWGGDGSAVTWATLRGGSGYLGSGANINIQIIDLEATTTMDRWGYLARGIILFDTSSLGSDVSIDSATFSLYGTYKYNGLSLSDSDGALCLVSSAPASDTDIVAGDYDSLGITEFATRIGYSALDNSGYNDMTLNASGKSHIDKTGISKFGARLGCDLDNNEPAWSNSRSDFMCYTADRAGTTNDPKLVIEYSIASTTETDERDASIWGRDSENNERDASIYGIDSDEDERDASIFGIVKENDKRDAFIHGRDSEDDERNAIITGAQPGTGSDRGCSIWGIGAGTNDGDERDASIFGIKQDNDKRACSIDGRGAGTESTDERDCSIHGRDSDDSSRACSIYGKYGDIGASDRSCFIDGIEEQINTEIKPGKPAKISLGFRTDLLQVFDGKIQLPETESRNKKATIKMYDKIEYLRQYVLPEGSLKQEIRTDLYIESILQEAGYTSDDYELEEGVQSIDLAWYAGNTAFYEIEQAAQAEGGRFYQKENGKLVFENRQHYAVNDEHKHSVWAFDYDNMVDLRFPDNKDNLVNYIEFILSPREQQDLADVWNYGVTPRLAPGEEITIWADFDDPVSPITTPQATTDYTANVLKDGSGTNKTANISIDITKFASASKLVVQNTGTSYIYLTMLKIRGQAWAKQGDIKIFSKDEDSISTYGESKLDVSNKYMTDEWYAQTWADNITSIWGSPLHRMILKNRCVPNLQLGDMIGVHHPSEDKYYMMRVMKIKMTDSPDTGMSQDIHCREVTWDELADYFEIGASEISGQDIIAP